MKKRETLKRLALLPFALQLPAVSFAQKKFPDGPIEMVVPFAPGGHSSILARLFSSRFTEHLNTPIIILNRPGAGGAVGAESVVRATPDGKTLIFHASSSSIYSALSRRPPPYDPVTSFEHVGLVGLAPFVLAVSEKSAFKSLADLVEYARKNPGKLSYGSAGLGSSTNVAGERLKIIEGNLDILHVPYGGAGPAIVDTISQVVDFTIDNYISTLNLHNQGRLRILAVFADQRSEAAPDIPTAKEQGIDMVGNTFNLVSAPRGTSKEIIDILAKALHESMQEESLIKGMKELGMDPVLDSTPESTAAFITEQAAIVGDVVKKANLYVS